MRRGFTCKSLFIISCALLSIISPHLLAFAATDEDMQTLEMFFDKKDIASVATRSAQAVSKVAENLTIVTAREIEAINAHTLADVLRDVPGFQVNIQGGPGSVADTYINGASWDQFLVIIDGVQLNNLSDNLVNIGSIPVQNVSRIEIIKGPASSSWGPALGGVVNIVTKEPNEDARISGTASSSFGERGTADYRGELKGTFASFGYYINGGKLRSDGLLPHNGNDENNFYTKFNYDIPGKGSLTFSLGYNDSSIQGGKFNAFGVSAAPRYNTRDIFSSLSLKYTLSNSVDLELSGRMRSQDSLLFLNEETDMGKRVNDETSYGTSAKLVWREHWQSMVVGADYDHGRISSEDIDFKQSLSNTIDKWGLFLNDTLSFGVFSLSPGIRYDRTSYDGDFTSASLGMTWQLTDHTLLRGYVGKGYGIPSVIFNFAKEKTMAYQAGFETSDIPYLLLKTTFFMHRSNDAISSITGESERQVKQGIEVEVRTLSLFNTSIFAGYNFLDARSQYSGANIPGIASQTWNLGLSYDDHDSFHGALTGHYIWWNSSNEDNILPGKYNSFIWDVNLDKRIFTTGDCSAELFFTGHNILNGSQYQDGAQPNPRRWFEGGMRFMF